MEDVREELKKYGYAKPPKTVFVPSRSVIRKMMRAVLKFGEQDDHDKFLLRFGLVMDPIALLNGGKNHTTFVT